MGSLSMKAGPLFSSGSLKISLSAIADVSMTPNTLMVWLSAFLNLYDEKKRASP